MSFANQNFTRQYFKKDIFLQCGFFIESVRAGEDADWMSRVKLHQISIEDS